MSKDMIVITAEIWKGGDPNQRTDCGSCRITNTLDATLDSAGAIGDYRVEITQAAWLARTPGELWKACTVTGFPRRAGLGAWDLLYRALHDLVGVRNQEHNT